MLTRVINRINEHFGLSEAQIGRLSARSRRWPIACWRASAARSPRLTTPALVARIVRVAGVRLTAMEAARLVPVAGQLVAAGIGYWSINAVAMRHRPVRTHRRRVAAAGRGETERASHPFRRADIAVLATMAEAAVTIDLTAEASRPAANDMVRATVFAEAGGNTGEPGAPSIRTSPQASGSSRTGRASRSRAAARAPFRSMARNRRSTAGASTRADSGIARRRRGFRAARPVTADAAGDPATSASCRRQTRQRGG